MIPVGATLVSDDVRDIHFSCDIARCKGACCVAGDAGAPLDLEEIEILQENLEEFMHFMTPQGIEVVNEGGVFDYDLSGKYVTPLVNGCECAFAFFTGGMARCAIEKAWEQGKSLFRKPVSCHLYPIRISQYNGFDALNYHKWSVCHKALVKGKNENMPLFRFLREPLIRRYSEEWYHELANTFLEINNKP
ncbi:MAG: DUF3109 family protein [Bacteroidales bacterium]|nr:DUF3109 family protein [Bacteroidales bacterium]